MRKVLLIAFLFVSVVSFAQNTDYEKAWKAISENKRTQAAQLLQSAMLHTATYDDAYITDLYLKTYDGKEKFVAGFADSFYKKVAKPYPYIYAFWFNDPVMGTYGKKRYKHQENLMNELLVDKKAPGTIVAGAAYHKGKQMLEMKEMSKMLDYTKAIDNIRNWQFVGPFENISKNGFYKNYGPLEHPGQDAVFKSSNGAEVKWFTPETEVNDGWMPFIYQFNKETAVLYAQSFVYSPDEKVVNLDFGVNGSFKVWVNDELLLSEYKEQKTELDAFTIKCSLNKGYNRVLVQVGFTSNQYPNFIVRFTDNQHYPISGIEGSKINQPYQKAVNAISSTTPGVLFAEAFFIDKIKQAPTNYVNYLLLADVFLRNDKTTEARDIINKALANEPSNSLLRMKLLEILVKGDNRTLMLEEMEKIKKDDPESLVVLELLLKEMFNAENYDDIPALLEKRIALYGSDLTTDSYKIKLLSHEKKYDDLISLAEKMYEQEPEEPNMIDMMYAIKKNVYKDDKGALDLYEKYMKKHFDYGVYTDAAAIYTEMGNNAKALEIKKYLAELFSYDPSGYYTLCGEYYTSKDYKNADNYIQKSIALSPYNEIYWKKLGDIRNEQNNKAEAKAAYLKSLQYDPNQYDVINLVRKLDGKTEASKLFAETDLEKVIKADNPNEAKAFTDYGYYLVLDQKNIVIHSDGAAEENYLLVMRITNNKGVERYKETSISYSSSQSLLIKKAQLIKPNGARLDGERNGNEIVFTNLEAGDILVFDYRLQNYIYGRFAKEFWDSYQMSGQVYTAISRYNLLAPASLKLNYVVTNSDLKPTVKDVEDFKMYTWEYLKGEPMKEEPLMPRNGDVGMILHISTVPAWKDIASWYADVSSGNANEDIEIKKLQQTLFGAGKHMSQFEKARHIYDYIQANIRYSSVPFRQSAYVPQRPSATLTTRLGDCKDLSALFVTMAQMNGIKSQMVLVDTRDNGQKEMVLPSVQFNHCIAKANLDGKDYYIELTNQYLPFASLPNNLNEAAILEIPKTNESASHSDLKFLQMGNKIPDKVKRIMEMVPDGSDMKISVSVTKIGNPTAYTRQYYSGLDKEKQMKDMEQSIASDYKNTVKIQSVDYKNLDKLTDSIAYTYSYIVKDEINEIGTLSTFRIVYPDNVASIDRFSADTRKYPVEYWSYEENDGYETIVNITLPVGKKFVELPKTESFTFKKMRYELKYQLKAPNKLVVSRTFNTQRENITPQDYPAFKSFFEKIVKAEKKFIAYK